VTAAGVARADRALLRSALALAARGWHVFPCACGGKRPALRENWQDLATSDPARVGAWWTRAQYNIGIACGPSGLVVIDLDTPHGEEPGDPAADLAASGTDVLAALCASHRHPYPLPTYAVDTPGGCHLYYAAPARRVRNSAGRLGPLIDVRADGGYVIAAGSRIGERAYTAWDERTPVPLPRWIAGLLEDKPPQPAAAGPVPALRGGQGTAYAMAALRDETRLVAAAGPALATTRSTAPHSTSASLSPPDGSRRRP
jgi:hypothetical protein